MMCHDVFVVCLQVQMVFTRTRKEFGAPINLKDRKIDKTKEPYKECASYEDPAFVLNRVEMDTSVQVRTYHLILTSSSSSPSPHPHLILSSS